MYLLHSDVRNYQSYPTNSYQIYLGIWTSAINILFLIIPTHTLVALTGVTPQPTACRSPKCSMSTATGSNQVETYFAQDHEYIVDIIQLVKYQVQ